MADSRYSKPLTVRDKNVYRWRQTGMTYKEIGKRLGVCASRGRSIGVSAERKFAVKAKRLEDNLKIYRAVAKYELKSLDESFSIR